jgi:hypothetical protein
MKFSFDIWGTKSFSAGLEMLCLRAEESMAKNAAGTAATTAGTLGSQASGELGQLNPFLSREMHAEHGFDPSQMNEMLTAAGVGTGAAAGTAESALQRQAATTGNASGATKSLQEMERDRMKMGAETSESAAAQDVMGAKQLQQQGAAGMSGLYGENLKGQLSAMGQEAGDINAATEASKTGWVQNVEQGVKTAAEVAAIA